MAIFFFLGKKGLRYLAETPIIDAVQRNPLEDSGTRLVMRFGGMIGVLGTETRPFGNSSKIFQPQDFPVSIQAYHRGFGKLFLDPPSEGSRPAA